MERLYSPWRAKYIASFGKGETEDKRCVFCDAVERNQDEKMLIVWRGKACFIMMNLYPYNNGHLLVLPYRHVAALSDLTDEERLDMMKAVQVSMQVLERAMNPHGFNIGSNLGRVGGAGIVDHIHFHVVPRWNGDTNFMPILAETKVISEDLRDTLMKLRDAAEYLTKK